MGWFPCCCGGDEACIRDNAHCVDGDIACCLVLELSGLTNLNCSDCNALNKKYIITPPTGTFGSPFTAYTSFSGLNQCGFDLILFQTSYVSSQYHIEITFYSDSDYWTFKYSSATPLTCKTWSNLEIPLIDSVADECDVSNVTLTLSVGTFCECDECCTDGVIPSTLTIEIPSGSYCLAEETYILDTNVPLCHIDFEGTEGSISQPSYDITSNCCYSYQPPEETCDVTISGAFEFNTLGQCRLVIIFTFRNCDTNAIEFVIGYRSDWESAPHNCTSRSWTCNEFKNSGSYTCTPVGSITVES